MVIKHLVGEVLEEEAGSLLVDVETESSGNLFGSCAISMAVLCVADVAYTEGPILAAVDATQAVAAMGAIFLMALSLAAIVGGSEIRIGRLEPDAILLLLVCIGTLVAVGVAAS